MSEEKVKQFSGKFIVRLPRSLHAKISCFAEIDGVSMNEWVTAALAEHVGRTIGHLRVRKNVKEHKERT